MVSVLTIVEDSNLSGGKRLLNYMFLILRYLESCNIPITVKRKYQFSSNTTSSNSDDDKKDSENGMQVPQDTATGV